MNAEFFWTAVALAFAGLIIAPFYLAIFIAFDKARAKNTLDFMSSATNMEKEVKFDKAVERLFEEGVTE